MAFSLSHGRPARVFAHVPVDGRAGPLHGEPRLIHIAAERQIFTTRENAHLAVMISVGFVKRSLGCQVLVLQADTLHATHLHSVTQSRWKVRNMSASNFEGSCTPGAIGSIPVGPPAISTVVAGLIPFYGVDETRGSHQQSVAIWKIFFVRPSLESVGGEREFRSVTFLFSGPGRPL